MKAKEKINKQLNSNEDQVPTYLPETCTKWAEIGEEYTIYTDIEMQLNPKLVMSVLNWVHSNPTE